MATLILSLILLLAVVFIAVLLRRDGRLSSRCVELEKQKILAEAQQQQLETQLSLAKDNLQEVKNQMKMEFENLANNIFNAKRKSFHEESERNLQQVLSPLQGRLEEFKKRIEEIYHEESKEVHSLKKEIEKIANVNLQMTEETRNLTKALKGDVKAQGDWGEMILDKILESSGLREGEEFVRQGEGLGLKDEAGRAMKPDILINLPDGKHIIIDSKVTLPAYDRYISAVDEDEKQKAAKDCVASLKAHVAGLADKKYHMLDKIIAPDFVLLFMFSESLFSVVMQADNQLFQYAFEKKVVIVSPTTLLATLKTVESVWKVDRQNKNAMLMAEECGKMYDQFVRFTDDLTEVGHTLDKVKEQYGSALDRLHRGRGNLVGRAEKIRLLGAKVSKKISPQLIEDSDDSLS